LRVLAPIGESGCAAEMPLASGEYRGKWGSASANCNGKREQGRALEEGKEISPMDMTTKEAVNDFSNITGVQFFLSKGKLPSSILM
jgi:hypothetical protein